MGKRLIVMNVPGKIGRGRPKQRSMDGINHDLTEKGLSGEHEQDGTAGKRLIRHIHSTYIYKRKTFLMMMISMQSFDLDTDLATTGRCC